MLLQILNFYFYATLYITAYFFYDLYIIEDSFYLFSLRLTNSIFYICLFYNFIFMLFLLFLNCITYILFGKITKEELNGIKLELYFIIFRFCNSLDFSEMYKILDNIPKLFCLRFLSSYISFITEVTYARGNYLISENKTNKINKRKNWNIFLIYIILIYFNYLLYDITIIQNINIEKDIPYEYFLYYIINFESFGNFIKILEGLFKLIINITCINMEKLWKYENSAFNIISILKYLLYLSNININKFWFIEQKFFLAFFVFELKNIFELFLLIIKIYANYCLLKYLRALNDYDIKKDLDINENINKNMTEEEINTIKKEKIIKCIICFCEIEKGKYLNCGHIFHFDCIKEWLTHYRKCPFCNCHIDLKSNEKSDFYNKRLGIKESKIHNNNNINDTIKSNINIKTEKEMINKELDNNDLNIMKKKNNIIKEYNDINTQDNNNMLDNDLRYEKLYGKKEKINCFKETQNSKYNKITYNLPTESLNDKTSDNNNEK